MNTPRGHRFYTYLSLGTLAVVNMQHVKYFFEDEQSYLEMETISCFPNYSEEGDGQDYLEKDLIVRFQIDPSTIP